MPQPGSGPSGNLGRRTTGSGTNPLFNTPLSQNISQIEKDDKKDPSAATHSSAYLTHWPYAGAQSKDSTPTTPLPPALSFY